MVANRVLALVLTVVCFCFLFDGSTGVDGLTFSSNLIHRFSDKAKVLWISGNRNFSLDSWLKRNSFEYLQLHYTWIGIGTPNASFLVALDAGSNLLWVLCDCMRCAPLSASYYTSLDRDLSEYSPSLSSTNKHHSCSHQRCELGPTCKNLKEPCLYIANYDDAGNTSSSGFLVEDKQHLTSVSDNATRGGVQASFDNQVNAQRISFQGGPWNYCYTSSSRKLGNIPAVRLHFLMNQSILKFTMFCLALHPTDLNYGIIGQNFMTGNRVVFDMENLKLGWSNSNCQDISDNTEVNLAPPPNAKSPNPLPTNEQHSIPNKHAVAPAVARRASSKASQHIPSLLHLSSSLALQPHIGLCVLWI
ncbi:hypothetical protein P3X46_021738 [Hevea brasiliensis]|uniref:Peptidase A1 domain-containing protein n=1 Tax=Hevea brasiliensis TaxID=3981 RepID=A0ABQ9LGH8_HEVBR|nr:hypothetical protein P3X46_021738 [Hevea brasiliensis]